MPLAPHHRDGIVEREVGSLALSCVRAENPMLTMRAAQWRNTLTQVGLEIPFWAIHDIGMVCVVDPTSVPMGPRPSTMAPGGTREALAKYTATLRELGASEVAEKARQWGLEDPLIAVLLLKVLAPIYERYAAGRRKKGALGKLPLDPEAYRDLDAELPQLFAIGDRSFELSFLNHIATHPLRLITAFEQVDLDTLRLVGMFDAGAAAAGSLGMLDLLGVFESPEANDVVNFSLELLPSVLETKRASGQQSFSVDGYSGVTRRGTIDSLVLSELAFDPDLFARRFAEKEVFYYAREKENDEDRRLHYIVVDASASMRGRRATFARGLALTLLKKLTLRGEDVYFRFFDSRLYDTQRARPGRSDTGGISVPYILQFKGEHGRNYAKVFGLLANDIQRLQKRERRTPILYILTHAECHVPLDTIERLRGMARLYGVFMLPSSGELELDYLDRLHTVQIVDEAALSAREERAERALAIVEDAARDEEATPRTSVAPASLSVPPPGGEG